MKFMIIFSTFVAISSGTNFDEIASLIESSMEKVTKIEQNFMLKNKNTTDLYQDLKELRENIKSDLHVLEQGLLSGNEGRMSGLIGKVKSSVEILDQHLESQNVQKDVEETTDAIRRILVEIQLRLKGDPGWTPSWHYISQFLEAFLYNLKI